MTRHYMGMGEFAAHAGLTRSTLNSYGEKNLLPTPDVTVGEVRGWRVETIDKWLASRPGRGARTDLARKRPRGIAESKGKK